MENYELTLSLLKEAMRIMIAAGDSLAAAHIATPIDVVEARLVVLREAPKP